MARLDRGTDFDTDIPIEIYQPPKEGSVFELNRPVKMDDGQYMTLTEEKVRPVRDINGNIHVMIDNTFTVSVDDPTKDTGTDSNCATKPVEQESGS